MTGGEVTDPVGRSTPAVANFERAGVGIRYRVEGTGPGVVFVHSATSTAMHEWGALVSRLIPTYHCVLPDLRSHGASDHQEGELGLDEVVADLVGLIEHEELRRPVFIAFSFGAEVALELEIRYPGTSSALVLVSPGTGHPLPVPKQEVMVPSWPRALRDLHVARHGPDHWRTILQMLSDDAAERPQIPDEMLTAISCPLLLIVGSEDQRRRVRQARHFAEVNSGAQLEVIEGAGHAVHLAEPEWFADRVLRFLAEIGSRPPSQRG